MNFQDMSVSVLGMGRSGLALTRELSSRGARVLISDSRPREELNPALEELGGLSVEVEVGGHSDRVLQADLLVLSPGVPVHHPLVKEACRRGLPVMGEVEIAWRLSGVPFIAVTGTNGKSTTVTLIDRILGERSILAGNIGNPLVGEVAQAPPGGYVVAEISSFQLETVHAFQPRIAVLTNLTPDHLDRHADLEEYFAAKARLFARQGPQDVAVISSDDPQASRLADLLESHNLPGWLPGFPPPDRPACPEILRFSVRGPVLKGAWFVDGALWYRGKSGSERLFDWGFPGLPGPHNLANSLAAVAVARWLGIPAGVIHSALEAHIPLHHRMEEVGRPGGVLFVNDSKSTNPASVQAALESYQAPILLIAGGKDKGTDFSGLGRCIARRARTLLVLGEAADRLAESARVAGMNSIIRCASLQEAVVVAWKNAQPGDVVLLSPACASYDMFRNAEERGRLFAQAVRCLEEAHPGALG
ncbi:MAG: UDP-N-acetylmuramoyl-L-alanine--D-glutamate ligase [Burkholderiales bacterium]|nr:UDP-N-acetylmuramoyl-L-alanine--D-glutamate ligase [Burkholderiales bacterium]